MSFRPTSGQVPTCLAAVILAACGSSATRLVTDDLGVVPLDGGTAAADAGVVDAAPAPVCDKGAYEGEFRIEGADARADIERLAGYTEAHSLLVISTTDLESLAGLECLRRVRCDLSFLYNKGLRSLAGLANLEFAGRIAAGDNRDFPAGEFDALVARVEQRYDKSTCAPQIGPGFELDDDFGLGGRREPRPDPPEVIEDGKQVEEQFKDFEELAVEGPPTDPRPLLRAVPRDYREELREGWVEYDDETEKESLRESVETTGVWLDQDRTRFLAQWGVWAVGSLVTLHDADGRLLHKLFFEQRLGVMFKDVVGDETLEIVFNVIEGNALSSWPVSWWIYELRGKKLARIARFAKEYSSGSKYQEYYFVNEVTFPSRDVMNVECVLFGGLDAFEDLDPPRGYPRFEGERHEYQYRKGRFVKTFSSKPPKPADKKHKSLDDGWDRL